MATAAADVSVLFFNNVAKPIKAEAEEDEAEEDEKVFEYSVKTLSVTGSSSPPTSLLAANKGAE
jgi:hypothetical protein